jgi:hypothetical protein
MDPQPHGPTEEEIREKAYYLYLSSGCTPGRDLENWLTARKLLQPQAVQARDQKNRSEVSFSLHFPPSAGAQQAPPSPPPYGHTSAPPFEGTKTR